MVTATLGDTNGVDHLVLGEDGVDGDLLLEVVVAPLDLLGNGTTVDLDLDQVGLLLAEGESLHLSVADGTDGDGVLEIKLIFIGDCQMAGYAMWQNE